MTTTEAAIAPTSSTTRHTPGPAAVYILASLAAAAFALGITGTIRVWTSDIFPDGWAILLAVLVLPLGPAFASAASGYHGLRHGRQQTQRQILSRATLFGVFAFLILPGLIFMLVLPVIAAVSYFA